MLHADKKKISQRWLAGWLAGLAVYLSWLDGLHNISMGGCPWAGTEGILSYTGVDEDKGKTSLDDAADGGAEEEADAAAAAGSLSLFRFDGRCGKRLF
jgi:hypothetical protein